MLQVQQTRDQPRRQCGSAAGGGEVNAERALDLVPVDQLGQAHQRMAHVDLRIQAGAKQILTFGNARLRAHEGVVQIYKESA